MEPSMIIMWVIVAVVVLFLARIIFGSFFTVETAAAGIVQRLGKFQRVAGPGLNFKIPFIDTLVAVLSLKVQQLDVKVETKTKDNVFVVIPVAVQYKVLSDYVQDAYYKLSDPVKQIESFVYNVILGHVPNMNLDEVFTSQAQIATDVQKSLDAAMREYGYSVVKSLITDVIPDAKVKAAMNDINAAAREREATVSRAETEKLLAVKKAEAEAQSKKLQGQGIADQRAAIISGLRESVETFQQAIKGTDARDVMTLVLITQYLDTLKDVGASARSNTIMLPHSPGALRDLTNQIRDAIISANVTADVATVQSQVQPPAGGPNGGTVTPV